MTQSPSSLLRFRESLYPGIGHFERWEQEQKVRNKNMTTYDYQHCAKLLAHPEMKAWVEKDSSGLIWVNSHQITKTVDWVSVLTTNLVNHAKRNEHITVLSHCCLGSYSDKVGSSPCLVVQSFMFQVLSFHRKHFLNNRSTELVVQRFEDARQDLDQLWDIFLEIVRTAKMACIWIVIDHVDVLTRESSIAEVLAFLACLDNLVVGADVTVKVLITARLCGTHHLSSLAAESGAIDPRHPIINVPRGYHRHDELLWLRHSKKPHRLLENRPNKYRGVAEASRHGAMSFEDSSDTSDSEVLPEHENKESNQKTTHIQAVDEDQSSLNDSDSSDLPCRDILASSEAETTSSESKGRRSGHVRVKTLRYSSSDETSDDCLTLAIRPESKGLAENFSWDTDSSNDIRLQTLPIERASPRASPNDSPKLVQKFGHDSVAADVQTGKENIKTALEKQVGKKAVTFDSDFDESDD